ncbi:hypothetical protein A8F94_18275 [Bacillus sp. FJAT-27225]|uniref:hypothetical protein n=1 Tax=Bacillus sp. FJAT-27225 TaxID=1743144 RepID=UPI00080C23DD|nr:hypothetical protein [Bacillus sp. FJAT-27225]OCA83082.1 hypothetical protein A8F94_18275 [Bacillus sp. FJAT-27225]
MLKKSLVIIILLFLMVTNKAFADLHINIKPSSFAAIELSSPQDTPVSAKTHAETEKGAVPFQSYIIPIGAAGLIIVGLGFYWIFLRKRLT